MDKMSLTKALELLKIERECVKRQNGNGCQRELTNCCAGCDLVQSDVDILQMYDTVINLVTNYVDYQHSVKEWAKCLPGSELKDIKKVISESNLNMSDSSTVNARGISCE